MTNFIEKELTEKIRKDQWEFKIGNERDFESTAYYYLRAFLNKEPKIKISTNYMIKGTPVWKLERKKGWKKHRWIESDFIMPDILISKLYVSHKKTLKHKIAFELKTITPSAKSYPNFLAEKFQLDFRKLNRLKHLGKINQGYYLLIYSDPKMAEDDVREKIEKSKFQYSARRKTAKMKRFKTLLINRYLDPDTKNLLEGNELAKRQEKLMRIWRTYGGKDPREDYIKKLTNKNGGNAQKKANETIYKNARSLKYRLAHPDAPMVKKYINDHNLKR